MVYMVYRLDEINEVILSLLFSEIHLIHFIICCIYLNGLIMLKAFVRTTTPFINLAKQVKKFLFFSSYVLKKEKVFNTF